MKITLTNLSDRCLRFALLAHDARKDGLVTWVGAHQSQMMHVRIVSTGTTGGRITGALSTLDATTVRRGPPGGDQQIGALICEEKLDALVFFVDPLSPMPHDVDVKPLTRLATVYDLPMACSQATADLIVDGLRKERDTAPT